MNYNPWGHKEHGVTTEHAHLSLSLIPNYLPNASSPNVIILKLRAPCVDLDGREGSHSVHSKQDCRKTEAKWEGVSFGGKGVLCTVSEELRGMKWKDI